MTAQLAAPARQEPEILRSIAQARIAWVLNHPHMSDWLKSALRAATQRDPTDVQNDIEILRHLFASCADAEVALALSRATIDDSDIAPD